MAAAAGIRGNHQFKPEWVDYVKAFEGYVGSGLGIFKVSKFFLVIDDVAKSLDQNLPTWVKLASQFRISIPICAIPKHISDVGKMLMASSNYAQCTSNVNQVFLCLKSLEVIESGSLVAMLILPQYAAACKSCNIFADISKNSIELVDAYQKLQNVEVIPQNTMDKVGARLEINSVRKENTRECYIKMAKAVSSIFAHVIGLFSAALGILPAYMLAIKTTTFVVGIIKDLYPRFKTEKLLNEKHTIIK